MGISIHAPLTGCDPKETTTEAAETTISIHAPLTGCDHFICLSEPVISDFNPRTPDGVRPRTPASPAHQPVFQSTHP